MKGKQLDQLIAEAASKSSGNRIGNQLRNPIIEFIVTDQKYTFPESKINIKTKVL